jgi:oligosaccharide repeat unit polymerase
MLIMITTGLGVLNILICRIFIKRLVSPALFYWIAWVIGIACADLAAYWDILPPITSEAEQVILQSHLGSFIGFFFSSLLFGKPLSVLRARNWIERVNVDAYSEVIKRITVFLLMVSIVHLSYRLIRVGADLLSSSNPFFQIRYNFLYEDIGLTRYFNHLASGLFAVAAFQGGMLARKERLAKITVGMLILAAIIQSLALYSRHYLFEVFLALIAGYSVALSDSKKHQKLKPLIKNYLKYVVVILIIFTVMGNLREERTVIDLHARQGTAPVWVPTDALSYAGVPVAALGPLISNLGSKDRTYGGFAFEFIFNWLARLGLVNSNYVFSYAPDVFGQEYIRMYDPRIGWCQGTALAYLVSDYGTDNLWMIMGALMAIYQALFLVVLKKGATGYFIASYCCLVVFMTIQFPEFVTGKFVFALLYAALLAHWVKSYERGRVPLIKGPASEGFSNVSASKK